MASAQTPLVLIAEDDVDTRRILTARLTRDLHLDVVEVGDGEAALEFLSAHTPDLLCIDLGLPIVSGYEVCRRTRSREETQDMRILVVSGRDGLEDLAWAQEMGIDAFLSKPFKARVFLRNVEKLLDGRLNGAVRAAS